MVEAIEAISQMTWGEIAGAIALGWAGLSTIIEISPIKVNPWTWLFRAIGRAINGELMEKIDQMDKDIKRIDHDAGERRAKDARARILRFGDELVHDVHHSKEHFDDVLHDITEYKNYCDAHPEFENDRLQLTAKRIEEVYMKCLEEHSFL